MYRQMEYGCQTYPGFFSHHSMGFMQQDAAGRAPHCGTVKILSQIDRGGLGPALL